MTEQNYALSVLLSALSPVRYLFDPSKRIYFLFLASSGLLAMAVYLRANGTRPRTLAGLVRFLLPRRLWLHASSRFDLKLMIIKALLHAALVTPLLLPMAAVTAIVSSLLKLTVGDAPAHTWSHFNIAATYSLCAFVVDDASRYFFHRWMHSVPCLWELHKVHHSARVLTPLTVYRTHPIESVLYRLRGVLTLGCVTGVFFFFFRGRLSGWDILGVDTLGVCFNLAGANLRHSHVWLSWGTKIEHLIVSPAQHQLHHSLAREHYNKNFGVYLAIWDWLGGSLLTSETRPRLRFGLSPACNNHTDTLRSALIEPLWAAFRRLRKQRPRSDKTNS